MEVIVFIFQSIAVVLALITLPGSVYLLFLTLAGSLYAHRERPTRSDKETSPVDFAVIVPAHNESTNVLVAINSLKACDPPLGSYEVFIVADNCTDDTAEISRGAGSHVLERVDENRRGKGYALEFAFRKLMQQNFDAFIVMDADTQCESNMLVEFEKKFSSGADILQAPYLVSGSHSSFYAQIVNIGFKAFNYLRPSARELLGLSVGIFGTGFALQRGVLSDVPYRASSIVEDMEYHMNLVRSGYVSKFVPETAVYSAMPENTENAKTQRSRWEGGRLRMIMDRSWSLIRDILRGKWRLLDPLLELLLLPLSLHVVLLTIVASSMQSYLVFYGVCSILLVVAHVMAAIMSTGGGIRELKALLLVPRYIIWKVLISHNILKSSDKTANWDRTPRE